MSAGRGTGVRRVFLVGAGLLAAAVALEAGLRVAAALERRRASRAGVARPAGPGGITVLCEGDSSVYGLYVEADDAFPARLERLLNAGVPGAPHRVVNRGVPGTNSRQAIERLEAEIPRYRPAAVVWHCGLNDLWALPDGVATPSGGWFDDLRVVRLFRLLAIRFGRERREARARGALDRPVWRTREGDEVALDLQVRTGWLEASAARGVMERSLADLARLARGAAALPLVVLYPPRHGPFAVANGALGAAALAAGVATVDPGPDFARAVEIGGREHLYFHDYHPRALGYEILARRIHDALADAGVVSGPAPGDPLEGLSIPRPLASPEVARDRSRPDLRLVGSASDPEGPRFEIRDRPGLSFRLLVSLADRPKSWIGEFDVDLATDAIYLAALARRDLVGTFDEAGLARIPLRRVLGRSSAPAGTRFFAAYAILRAEDDPWVLAVSGSVELAVE